MLHQNFVTSGADVTDITNNIEEGQQYFNVYAVCGNESSSYGNGSGSGGSIGSEYSFNSRLDMDVNVKSKFRLHPAGIAHTIRYSGPPNTLPNVPTFVIMNVGVLFKTVPHHLKADLTADGVVGDYDYPLSMIQDKLNTSIVRGKDFIIAPCNKEGKWLGENDLVQRNRNIIATDGKPIGHMMPKYCHAYVPIFMMPLNKLPTDISSVFAANPRCSLILFRRAVPDSEIRGAPFEHRCLFASDTSQRA
jgi:hypothetical protein